MSKTRNKFSPEVRHELAQLRVFVLELLQPVHVRR